MTGGRDYHHAVKRVAERTVELSIPQQVARDVDAQLVKGNPEGIGRLAGIAGELDPVTAVKLLEGASAFCSATAIEELYAIFEEFEFTCNALALALIAGKTENAIALIGHGARLEFDFDPLATNPHIPGDTPEKRNLRFVTYMSRALSGTLYQWSFPVEKMFTQYKQHFDGAYYIDLFSRVLRNTLPSVGDEGIEGITPNPKATADTIGKLAATGLLSPRQLSSLAMAAAHGRHYREASIIASLVEGPLHEVSLVAWEGDPRLPRQERLMHSPCDLLYPGCEAGMARFVVRFAAPGHIRRWSIENFSEEYLDFDHEVIAILMPHLDPSVKDTPDMTLVAAAFGLLDELERAFAPNHAFGEEAMGLMQQCLSIAQRNARIEAAAWLLERSSQLRAARRASGMGLPGEL